MTQPQPPFDDQEVAELRDIIASQKRAKWLWASIRVWTMWISGFIVGTYAVIEVFGKAIKRLFP